MVFAERYRRRRFNEAREEGRLEGLEEGLEKGRKELNAAWVEWLQRRDEAQRNNQPFDEPPPSERGHGKP